MDDPFKPVFDALAYANDVVNGKLDVSKKENEFIYHDKVPDLDALQEIKVGVKTGIFVAYANVLDTQKPTLTY